MRGNIVEVGFSGAFARKLQGLFGDGDLRQPTAARDLLGDVAVAIAGGEIHLPIGAAGILAQPAVDHAHGLDELAPVHHRQETQAADAAADRHLLGRLLLVSALHHLRDGLIAIGQPLLDPPQRQRQRRTPALQPARELGHERAGDRGVRACHVGNHQHQALGVGFGDGGEPISPQVGEVLVAAIGDETRADPTQVLDQRQPQHDRDRPQFAELERRDFLVGGDEAAQAFGVHPPVAVRDRVERDVVDARQSRR